MTNQGFPFEGADSRWNPLWLLDNLQRRYSFPFDHEPLIWTRRDGDWDIWFHYHPPLIPSDPIGWLSVSHSPARYVALNLPWFGGKVLHASLGGRYMIANDKTPEAQGWIIRPTLALKVRSTPLVW